MKTYSRLINCIAACMSPDTQTFTRYNRPDVTDTDKETGVTYSLRDVKMVFSNYKDEGKDVSFTLRGMEMSMETAVPTKEDVAEKIKKEDSSLAEFGDLSSALAYAKIDFKYLTALCDALVIGNTHTLNYRGATIITASNKEGHEYVSLFFQVEDRVVVLQFKL